MPIPPNFCTALELRVLLPDPARGPGFWLVTVNRSRSDGLSGFTGRVIRGRVRSAVEDGMRAALTATKKRLESLDQSSANPPSSGSARQAAHDARRSCDAHRTSDFISSPRLGTAPASSKPTH
jgi:hypothetical protein